MAIIEEKNVLGADCEFIIFYDDVSLEMVGFKTLNNSKQKLKKGDLIDC